MGRRKGIARVVVGGGGVKGWGVFDVRETVSMSF